MNITNNSSPEEIRSSDLFVLVSSKIWELWLKDVTDIATINEDALIVSLSSIDVHDLRLLKQALNNQICLSIFQIFLDWVKDIWPHELIMSPEWKDLEELSIENYLNWWGKEFQKVAKSSGNSINLIKASQWVFLSEIQKQPFLAFIKNPLTRKLFPRIKRKMISFYVGFYLNILREIFDSILIKYIESHSDQADIIVYHCLETYIEKYTTENSGVWFTSRTLFLLPNTNAEFILRVIELGYSYEEIERWLKRHVSNEIKNYENTCSTWRKTRLILSLPKTH